MGTITCTESEEWIGVWKTIMFYYWEKIQETNNCFMIINDEQNMK
jgi:hypothetical protein